MEVDNLLTLALKSNPGMRISYEEKWMVWDTDNNHWQVFGKKRYQKTTRTLHSGRELQGAVEILKKDW
jgi:hypothetical protein